jgi:oxygen-independent coproporphyrinogen-3 oxidase
MPPSLHAPGLYVHVPFCSGKCPYCDFYSLAAPRLIPGWIDALETEARLWAPLFPGPFGTLYFGGGTPSHLPDGAMDRLLGLGRDPFRLVGGAEITFEVNPENASPDLVRKLAEAGINRISLGIQSFDDHDLAMLGRRHNAAQAGRAIRLFQTAGCFSLSLDLMYHLPGQTLDGWRQNLEAALAFQPEHLSCYGLTIEGSTAFGRAAARGTMNPADEETARAFFLFTSVFLEDRGFVQYEVSNFSQGPDHPSRHNGKYWDHTPYLGLGPSAHSFHPRAGSLFSEQIDFKRIHEKGTAREGRLEPGTDPALEPVAEESGNPKNWSPRRWWNHRSVRKYVADLTGGRWPIADGEALTADQMRLERIYLGLRTRAGIDLTLLTESGRSLALEAARSGLAVVDSGRLRLTRDALVLADRLAVDWSE